ncbi:MAG TPA: TonB-dependent receptor [Chitinophagales bacterium]|nr:TonB-dependent receptor [Chitinophagales bacterium]HRK27798.1 TonB-dependent receptor [Chitinophagales bacterium]
MNKFFILFFLLGLVYSANAQTLTVIDSQTGNPIDRATLMSAAPQAFTTTNAQGQADISAFKDSEKIEIRCLGYKTEITNFDRLQKMSFEVLLTASATQFDVMVVSATRWSQTLRKVPAKISVISTKDIALQNPQTAADLLGASGEVFIQKSQQGGGSPMIRGFSTNRLLYTIDGIRMNSAIFRAGNIQNVISLDAFTIENTEVLFGPGSVIYGSDAIGGVMSFQTLTPRLSLSGKPQISGNAVSRYSSANSEITNHFDVQVGWKKWSSVTGFTHSKFGDLRMGKHGPDEYLKTYYVQRIDSIDRVFENPDPRIQNPTGYTQMNLMQKIRFTPNKKWDFQYGFHYSETGDYARYDRLIEKQSNGLPVSAVWNYGPQIWMLNNLTVTHTGNNRLYNQMTIRLAQQYFEESRIDRRLNNHRLRTNLEQVQAYSVNVDFEKSANKHQFVYGAEYVLNDVTSTGTAVDIRNGNPIPVPDRYPASEWSSYAGYVNYQFLVSDKFTLQAGARYGAFHIQSDFTRQLDFFPFDFTTSTLKNAATTGSIGLVFTPDETWKVSINGSTGFRAPNVDDIGKIFDFVSGEVIVPNTALKAEYAYNAEVSITKIIGNVVKLDATGFYTYLNNAMVRRPFQVNGQDSILYNGNLSRVYAIQNAAYGTVYGVNAGIEVKLPGGFSLASRYNYQLGKEEMNNAELSPSRHAAPAFGVTRLSYQKDKLFMQLYVMYNAQVSYENLNPEEQGKPAIYAKDANGNPYSPGWYTLNFKAMHQFHQNLSVSAGVENLTDQRYRPYSSGLVAPGRNLVISVRANF